MGQFDFYLSLSLFFIVFFLVLLCNSLALVLSSDIPVELSKLSSVDLGGLEQLHLADKHVVDGVDPKAALLDLLADVLGDELLHEVLELAGRSLAGHDLDHPLADAVHAAALRVHSKRVPGATHSVSLLGSERNAEHADKVAVSGLHLGVSLDESLPLLDERLQTVVGQVHPVEGGQALAALHLVNPQLDLAVPELLVLVQVAEVQLEHTPSQRVCGNLQTDGLGHAGLARSAVLEHVGGHHVVPLLAKEGVGPLLAQLAAGSFVLANCHLLVVCV